MREARAAVRQIGRRYIGRRWRDISSVIRAVLKSPKLQSFKRQRRRNVWRADVGDRKHTNAFR